MAVAVAPRWIHSSVTKELPPGPPPILSVPARVPTFSIQCTRRKMKNRLSWISECNGEPQPGLSHDTQLHFLWVFTEHQRRSRCASERASPASSPDVESLPELPAGKDHSAWSSETQRFLWITQKCLSQHRDAQKGEQQTSEDFDLWF